MHECVNFAISRLKSRIKYDAGKKKKLYAKLGEPELFLSCFLLFMWLTKSRNWWPWDPFPGLGLQTQFLRNWTSTACRSRAWPEWGTKKWETRSLQCTLWRSCTEYETIPRNLNRLILYAQGQWLVCLSGRAVSGLLISRGGNCDWQLLQHCQQSHSDQREALPIVPHLTTRVSIYSLQALGPWHSLRTFSLFISPTKVSSAPY